MVEYTEIKRIIDKMHINSVYPRPKFVDHISLLYDPQLGERITKEAMQNLSEQLRKIALESNTVILTATAPEYLNNRQRLLGEDNGPPRGDTQ